MTQVIGNYYYSLFGIEYGYGILRYLRFLVKVCDSPKRTAVVRTLCQKMTSDCELLSKLTRFGRCHHGNNY